MVSFKLDLKHSSWSSYSLGEPWLGDNWNSYSLGEPWLGDIWNTTV